MVTYFKFLNSNPVEAAPTFGLPLCLRRWVRTSCTELRLGVLGGFGSSLCFRFRIKGLGFRIKGLGFRVLGLGYRA